MDGASSSAGDVDRLVDVAVGAVARLARRGSVLTTGVALVAAVIVGGAYLIGIAAFTGGDRTIWLVAGGLLLAAAVGAPLLASVRLRGIPRRATALSSELRALLGRSEEAKRVVVETFDRESTADSGPTGRQVPAIVVQGQQFSRLRTIAGSSGELATLIATLRRLATLPGLVAIGIALTGVGAVLGFVFFLIWIF